MDITKATDMGLAVIMSLQPDDACKAAIEWQRRWGRHHDYSDCYPWVGLAGRTAEAILSKTLPLSEIINLLQQLGVSEWAAKQIAMAIEYAATNGSTNADWHDATCVLGSLLKQTFRR